MALGGGTISKKKSDENFLSVDHLGIRKVMGVDVKSSVFRCLLMH